MYIDRVIEEDNKMVESWKGDADGMLVFVSFQSTTSDTSAFNFEIIDWPLLCCDRDFAISVYPGYSAPGQVSFLSRIYLLAIF
jgi:hypothetical protein